MVYTCFIEYKKEFQWYEKECEVSIDGVHMLYRIRERVRMVLWSE